jgi:hypothetical protein
MEENLNFYFPSPHMGGYLTKKIQSPHLGGWGVKRHGKRVVRISK